MEEEMISVVLATYNGEKYLPMQLESIVHQTYKNIEIICVDDLSEDSTIEILRHFQRQHPHLISIHIGERNLGSRKNFERGCRLAKGKYIAFSDQDDWWRPDKLEILHRLITSRSNLAFVYSDAAITNESLNITEESFLGSIHRPFEGANFYNVAYENMVMGCTMLAATDFVKRALPFPEKGYHHDYYLAIMAKAMNYEVDYINEPLIKYRRHAANIVGRDRSLKVRSNYKARTERRYQEVSLLDFPKFTDQKLLRILRGKLEMLDSILHKNLINALRYYWAYYRDLKEAGVMNRKVMRSDLRLIFRGMFF
ncbi:MAG: hypothetical protein CO189_07160 [candidate division Zixibacteria bacterium CG_4_9_14_3_um_filter_46_8]|nr:MAG: hypothetical protein CO189_07160 [candidate division Zixibacteria bacterium CG_4_9_14_3_um_filter_46_8]